jgi:hypothetical protein
MNAQEKVLNLLRRYKCKKLRTRRHIVYQLPNGGRFTMPSTPGELHSYANSLSNLRVALGISARGKKAKPAKPAKKKVARAKRVPQSQSPDVAFPVVQVRNFKDKLKVAIEGEPPEPLPPLPPEKPQPRFKPRLPRAEEKGRCGPVRVWSQSDIDAANIAMRSGKLDEYMQRHDQAATSTHKEETQMLQVEQIDVTIQELEAGMVAALGEVKLEQEHIQRLEGEIVSANQRMTAANDKHNSLNDVKTSLGVIRGDLERVRPMLGLLATKPGKPRIIMASSGGGMKLRDALIRVLESSATPLTPAALYNPMVAMLGREFARTSIYGILCAEGKKNGDAEVVRVGDGLYSAKSRVAHAVPA